MAKKIINFLEELEEKNFDIDTQLEPLKKEIKKTLVKDGTMKKDEKITDESFSTYYFYYKNKDKEDENGYRLKLQKTPHLQLIYQPTCKNKKIEFENKLKQMNTLFDGVPILGDISFDKLIIDNQQKNKVFQEMKKIVKDFKNTNKGFYLYGSFNTSKTFFLKALAQELINKKINVLFLHMSSLTRKFKSFLYNNLLETRFEELRQIECLILDDLGAESITPWFRDEILLPLLHYRAEKKLPLFISSNYNFLQLRTHLTTNNFDNNLKANKIVAKIDLITQFYDFSQKSS
ncbi:ATP-binding protein [Candidatus Phytoplasma solani]|uniref:ATP-binding protein n=1 Tax=Candidatus Phytoplasma solani TaxID=69896 RepID=UPI00358FFB7A